MLYRNILVYRKLFWFFCKSVAPQIRQFIMMVAKASFTQKLYKSVTRYAHNGMIIDKRHPYHGVDNTFEMKDLVSKDPLKQFRSWYEEVFLKETVLEPHAMALATASKNGVPSVRMVLCKSFSEEGFVFYTNMDSKKGQELIENPYCSLLFYWEPFKRQVRIEGIAETMSSEVASKYFVTRPKDSQIGALVSKQSKVIVPDREDLDSRYEEVKKKYIDQQDITKPDYWGAFIVKPYQYEFWHGQTNRLHDRLQFRKLRDNESFNNDLMVKGEGDWIIERLSP